MDVEVFRELLPHMIHLTSVQRFLIACEREGGIAEVEKHDALIDLSSVCHDFIMDDYDSMNAAQFDMGTEALTRAISYGCIDNVQILLDQGAKLVGRTQLFVGWAKKEPEKFAALQTLFGREGSPRVELRRSHLDPCTCRHRCEGMF